MNKIRERQNEKYFLDLLAAMRYLYNTEKKWMPILVSVSLLIAVLWSGIVAFSPPVSGMIALLVVLVTLGEFAFVPMIVNKRKTAAKIQELFDCDLLEMPWNSTHGNKPSKIEIADAARKYREQPHNDLDAIANWYTADVDNLPLPQARIVAQLQNLRWDSLQRRDLSNWIAVALIALALILVTFGVLINWTIQQLLAGPMILLLPVFGIGLKYYRDHRRAAEQLEYLKSLAESVKLDAATGKLSDAKLTQRARELQNGIFSSRQDSPPVPNWFYERYKDKNDARSRED